MPPILVRFAISFTLVCAADAWFVQRALEANGGVFCFTTDDAFIHLQYARSFAELRPLAYQPGDAPTTGATSLLFPMVLAPGFWFGLEGMQLVWMANAVSALALGATMTAAWGFARRTVGPRAGFGAAISIMACPTFVLLAFGGMEVGLSSGLYLAATVGAALWWLDPDSRSGKTGALRGAALGMLGALSAIGRPEGLVSALVVAWTLALRPPEAWARWARRLSLLVPLPWFVPSLVAYVYSGRPSTSGAQIKLAPADPFRTSEELVRGIRWNASQVFTRLLAGEEVPGVLLYPALPELTYPLWGLGLLGLFLAFSRRAAFPRDARLAFLAWAAASSAVFAVLLYTWLGNMGRYALAFAPLIALTATIGVAALASELFDRLRIPSRARAFLEVLLPVAVAAVFIVEPEVAVGEHAEAAREIHHQQVAMAARIRELPKDAVVALNDAGAIAFLGERRTWDLVGLTSPGAALPRLSGVGSVFERLERLPTDRRPTHAAIYPGWFPGFAALGREIDRRTVDGPHVGGPSMILYELDEELYGAGAKPLSAEMPARVLDEVDIADVDSERAHGYEALTGPLPRAGLHVAPSDGRRIAEGGRPLARGDRASLAAAPGHRAVLATRLLAPRGARLEVRWNGRPRTIDLPAAPGFRERSLEIPADEVFAQNELERRLLHGSVIVAHDWLLTPRSREAVSSPSRAGSNVPPGFETASKARGDAPHM